MKKIIILLVCFVLIFLLGDFLIEKIVSLWLKITELKLANAINFELDRKIFAFIISTSIIISYILTKRKSFKILVYYSIALFLIVTLFVVSSLLYFSSMQVYIPSEIRGQFNGVIVYYNSLSILEFEMYGILLFFIMFLYWQRKSKNLIFNL